MSTRAHRTAVLTRLEKPVHLDAVLFDLDDTLFDHRHARLAGLEAIRRAEPMLGRLPLSDLDRTMERLLSDIHISLVLTGKISLARSRSLRMHKFLQEYHIELPRRRVQELTDLRVETYLHHRRAVPGAEALLRHLHALGLKVAVVTDNLRSEQEEKLRVTGLEGWVDHLVCSEQVGVTKPHPRMFRVALKQARTRPGKSVMVGDKWEYDVVGAARLGIRPVWFHRDSRPVPSVPHADELRSFRPLSHAASVIVGDGPRSR